MTQSFNHIKVIAAYQSRIPVSPPNLEPEYKPGMRLDANMEKKLKFSPLIVLVHGPYVVHADRPKLLSLQSVSGSPKNRITMVEVHIF